MITAPHEHSTALKMYFPHKVLLHPYVFLSPLHPKPHIFFSFYCQLVTLADNADHCSAGRGTAHQVSL